MENSIDLQRVSPSSKRASDLQLAKTSQLYYCCCIWAPVKKGSTSTRDTDSNKSFDFLLYPICIGVVL